MIIHHTSGESVLQRKCTKNLGGHTGKVKKQYPFKDPMGQSPRIDLHAEHFNPISVTLMSLFMAVDWAALTSPSISAPLKFLVCTDSSARSTSGASFLCKRMVSVWMLRIWSLPCWSGRPAIKTTSQLQNKAVLFR